MATKRKVCLGPGTPIQVTGRLQSADLFRRFVGISSLIWGRRGFAFVSLWVLRGSGTHRARTMRLFYLDNLPDAIVVALLLPHEVPCR